jgi:hypothetical protein
MRLKFYALTILCLATITACAHPLDRAAGHNAATRQVLAEQRASISGGGCDDVGQFIPHRDPSLGNSTLEASAAPHRR